MSTETDSSAETGIDEESGELAQTVANSDDLDDYLKRSIHDLRMTVLQTLSEVNSAQYESGLGESGAASYLYNSVHAYLLFIEQAVRVQGGKKYLTRKLGNIQIQPPDVYHIPDLNEQIKLSSDEAKVIGGLDNYPDPVTEQVRGLFSSEGTGVGYLDLPQSISERFTVDVRLRHQGQKTAVATGTTHIPRNISIEAFRLGNEFVTEEGLGLVEENAPDAKFDYSDLNPPNQPEAPRSGGGRE
jgi:hypothetical protein